MGRLVRLVALLTKCIYRNLAAITELTNLHRSYSLSESMSIQERTHDISLVGSHVKDLDAWARILNQSISASHPRAAGSRYTDVIVLLLRWEDDDLDVATEIAELDDTFRSVYGYRTEQWKIPSRQSHIALVRRILDLLAHPASGDKLLIVYYGGHGYMNDQRDCVWMA